jgi:phytoene synthase
MRTADAPLRSSYDYCVGVARRSARNFYYSFVLLPPARRRSMCALYAYMRRTDDLADDAGPVDARRAALERWRSRLDAALAASPAALPPDEPALPALVDTVRRHGLPPRYLFDVIEGVGMDLEPRPFRSFADLAPYCYRVASVVGLCCLHIWGYRSQGGEAEAMADACGTALQLTNILRDVREDAAQGRIYLPREELAGFGVAPEELATATAPTPPLRDLLRFQAERAYGFYERARPLERLVAAPGRPMLRAIVGIYRSLLDEIVRRDFDVFSRRVSLSPARKAGITLLALPGWTR